MCMEPFTDGFRKPVKCPHCSVEICTQCSKRTMLMWASNPKCVACNKPWSSDTVDTLFTKAFRRGPLRQQTIQNLLEQERSLFPQTSQRIDAEVADKEYKITEASLQHRLLTLLGNRVELTDELVAKLRVSKARMVELSLRMSVTTRKPQAARQERIATKCPGTGCLGYLNLASNCALCGIHVCKTCNKNVGVEGKDNHECNTDDVASWALIKSECKMCPKCSTPVSKVDGCNQMWCTACNTAFDWVSGRVVNGPVHNPHYADFLRRGGMQGLQVVNVECVDGHLHYDDAMVMQGLLGLYWADGPLKHTVNHVINYVRNVLELVDGRYGRRAHAEPMYNPQSHEDLRRKVLLKQISQEQWASTLSARETVRTKKFRLFQLDEMLRAASVDLLNRLSNDVRHQCTQGNLVHGKQVCKRYYVSMREIHKYYVQCQMDVISDYSDKTLTTLLGVGAGNQWNVWLVASVTQWLAEFDDQTSKKNELLQFNETDEVMLT